MGIHAAFQAINAVVFHHARIMACCHRFTIELTGAFEKMIKFEIAVAVDTGIRRPSPFIIPNEFLNDLLFKFRRKIKNVVFHPQGMRDMAGVFYVVQTTTGMTGMRYQLIFIEAHGYAHAFVACFLQQYRRHAGIDSTAHRDQNTLFHASLLVQHARSASTTYSTSSLVVFAPRENRKALRRSAGATSRAGSTWLSTFAPA